MNVYRDHYLKDINIEASEITLQDILNFIEKPKNLIRKIDENISIKNGKYPNDDYVTYLTRYRASIAATTFYPTLKYWENAAAGCLTFMEITEKNDGEFIGFRDNETCIYINEKNYEKKFQEFLSDPDNKKWEEIAQSGRDFAMNELNNDNAVKKIVDIMKELIY